MEPIKVGIIGYGGSAVTYHLPFIAPNPELDIHAFLQRREAPKGSGVAQSVHCTIDFPDSKHYRTSEAFFADDKIELVVICTNVDMHAELTERALRAGKHVVVEKPFTMSSKEADDLIALSKLAGKILTVNLVENGTLGEITEFESRYDMDDLRALIWDKPVPGDGMLYVLGGHTIDQALQLFGLPASVTAWTRSLRKDCKVDDAFTVTLQYAGEKKDLVCTLKTTVVSCGPANKQLRFHVRGTKGTFMKQIEHLMGGLRPGTATFGVEPRDFHGFLSTRVMSKSVPENASTSFDRTFESLPGSYYDYYEDVARAIRGERDVAVKPEESRNVIRVIELAKQSADKGITIPWS
ncbi:hypothetical protein M409DRAFT_71015 [Zasmidium cellare ATCC 36951]|uniref:Gfo/Idh/MocA-like oxidoreductase N-terminal domain-containing protein n=1 Tax=Zasmidium cellare ATCC 36951 TaxID=1080233 RepID=A0A6A6BXE0_ZASCE|nr:uncharacterized protein M409DRAFT_71015 [Zasmidium cellare ATCC 36951]KAF2159457.1 hypothetical protein M409DRAFT_71015 [Zasmidium cellare ATCC 36951]